MSYELFEKLLLKTCLTFLFTVFFQTAFSQPVADFKILKDKHCENTKVRFANTSGCDSICAFFWDYGDGLFHENNADTVSYIYLNPGVYRVRLIANEGTVSDTLMQELVIYKNPVADFVLDNYEGCAPLEVKISDNTIRGNAPIENYEWDLRFGITRTDSAFSFKYMAAGDYSLLLKVTDSNGCYDAIEREDVLKLYKQPSVDFSMDKSFSCVAPLTVNFNNETESPLSLNYWWKLSETDSVNTENASYTFNEEGVFSVRLEGENDRGCVGSATKTVSVSDMETSFQIIKDSIVVNGGDTLCKQGLILYNTSVGGGNIRWLVNGLVVSFGDSIMFEDFRDRNNIITLINSPGTVCADTLEKNIYMEPIKAYFSFDWENSCDFPQEVVFTDLSSNAVAWDWQLPQGGSSNVRNPAILLQDINGRDDFIVVDSIIYYEINLTVSSPNGCTASYSDNLMIDFPLARFVPDKVKGCEPLQVGFKDKSVSISEITHRYWLVDDVEVGNDTIDSLDYTFSSYGSYETKLVVESNKGCMDTSDVYMINVGRYLEPRFEVADNVACANEKVTFNNVSSFSDSIEYWHYRSTAQIINQCEQNPSPTVEIKPRWSGPHNVTLEVSNYGCVSSHTIPDAIYVSPPVGHIRDSMTCADPFDRFFETDAEHVSSYQWDLGDGSPLQVTPGYQHTYPSSGDYEVILFLKNDTSGCTYRDSAEVMVREVQAVISGVDEICSSTPLSFDASASVDYVDRCNIERFHWDFGDGLRPLLTYKPSVFHNYRNRGAYDITLVAYDVNGCTDTAQKTVVVHQPDVEMFIDDPEGCTPEHTVTFKKLSVDTTITNISWNFGDGNTLQNVDSVVHLYESETEKTFYSSLIATDIYGCRNIILQYIYLWEPNAEFTADKVNACVGDSIRLIPAYPNYDSVWWKFDDDDFVPHENKTAFSSRGDHTVGLLLFKDECFDTIIKEDYLNFEDVDASFAAYDTISQCYPERVLFKHVNIIDNIVQGNWDFDYLDFDTKGVYFDSVNFYYPYPGNYTPSLTVRTANGCADSAVVPILIKGPMATFAPSDSVICYGDSVTFEITDSVSVYDYEWFFGDGSSTRESSPTHQYLISDTVYPALWITDDNGCEPPVPYQKIYVSTVTSRFGLPENDTVLCVGEPLIVENNSDGGTTWQWQFDGDSAQHAYLPSGVAFNRASEQWITLVTGNDILCSDTFSRAVMVIDPPDIATGPNDTTCIGNLPLALSVETNPENNVAWFPTYSMDTTDIYRPTVQPDFTTTYYAMVSDDEGCQSKDSTTVYVYPETIVDRRPAGDTAVLLGENVTFTLKTNNPSELNWYDLPENGCPDCDTVTYLPQEDRSYIVQVSDVCATRDIYFNVHVRLIYSLDVPDRFSPNGDGINDIIFVKGGGLASLIEFKIFNRNGIEVFRSNSFEEGWNGYFNGKLQKPDSYVYQAKALTLENEEIGKTGTFLLVY